MNSLHKVFEYLHGYKVTHLLICAVELKLFDKLMEPMTVSEVAGQLLLHTESTEMMLNIFTGLGFLIKDEDRYQIEPCYRELLVSSSSRSMLPLFELEKHLLIHHNTITAMSEAMRFGLGRDRFNENGKEGMEETYSMAMDHGGKLAALHVARIFARLGEGLILDLGGGMGTYAENICRLNNFLRVDIYDCPEMEKVCMEHVKNAGLSDRVTFKSKNYLTDPIDDQCAGILLSNVLHLFPLEENQKLLQRCAKALKPGGILVVHDFFMEEGHIGSMSALLFSLDWLLIGSNFHMTRSDLNRCVESVGLEVSTWKQFDSLPTSIMVLEKRDE